MELIRDLEELQAARKSTRIALRICGIYDINAMMKPLAEMDSDAATKAVLNWVLFNSEEGQDYEIRLQVPERLTVYTTQLANRNGRLFIRNTREVPELIGKALHCWPNNVNYHMLTPDEVWNSVKRANAVNKLTEDVLQAAIRWKQRREK